jgi:hypothetical protein
LQGALRYPLFPGLSTYQLSPGRRGRDGTRRRAELAAKFPLDMIGQSASAVWAAA